MAKNMVTNGSGSSSETEINDSFRSMNAMSRVDTMELKINLLNLNLFKLRKPVDVTKVEALYIEFNELAGELMCEDIIDQDALTRLFNNQETVDHMLNYVKAIEKIKKVVSSEEKNRVSKMELEKLNEATKIINQTESKFPLTDVHHQDIMNKFLAMQLNDEKTTTIESRSVNDESIQQSTREETGFVKIEKKRLTKFSGDPIEYHKFRHDIVHYIIKNPQIQGRLNKLTEIQDLLPNHHRYLLNRTIRNESGTDDALKKLDEFYAAEHQIIPALKNKIKTLPILSQRATARDWSLWLETVVIIRDTLSAANLLHEDYNLTTYILYKVDDVYQQQIDGDNKIKLAQLESFLEKGATRKSAISGRLDDNPLMVTDRQRMIIKRHPNSVLIGSNQKTCFFQDGDHRTDDCSLSSDEKRQFLFTNRLCFSCGESGHNSRECNKVLRCDKCKRRHATQLCYQKGQTNVATATTATRTTINETTNGNVASTIQPNLLIPTGRSLHKTLVTIINGVKIRVVFDDGAGVSFISDKVANALRLDRSMGEPVWMDTLSKSGPTPTGQQVVDIEMPIWNGSNEKLKFRLNDKLDRLYFQCISNSLQLNLRKQGIEIYDEQQAVEMLIGLDNINKLQLPIEKRISDEVIAKQTTIGWVVFGVQHTTNVLISCDHGVAIENALDLDIEKEDQEAMDQFLDTYCSSDCLVYDKKRYAVKLPFIPNVPIKSNYDGAKKQVIGMIKNMTTDRRNKYQELIDNLISDEIVEQVKIEPSIGYHMPHFVVVRNDKNTTKMRMVFNASNGEQPLNKAIFKGVTAWYLIRSLLFFRLRSIGVISDIKAAFHNIAIQPEHRKFVKFLWVDNDDELRCYQFHRLPFGLSSSPFILYAVVMHHVKRYDSKYPDTVKVIMNGLYVDDLIFSADSKEEVEKIKSQSQEIFAEASMLLRKWRSSDQSLNKAWNDELGEKKVLGIEWDEDDNLHVAIPSLDQGCELTKRALLRYHASIYDPFGFVLATTLKLKLMIHKSWKLGYDWDDSLSPDLQLEAKNIIGDIRQLDKFKFQRRIFDQPTESYELMVFVDASKDAIGAAGYLTDGKVLRLIYGKSKLIKPRKIVSAELLALSMGANIAKTLKDLVNAQHVILLSDSMDNVKRLEDDINKFPYPVAVHLFNIKSKVADIRHIRGEVNPADAFTRGVDVEHLAKLHQINSEEVVSTRTTVIGAGVAMNNGTTQFDLSSIDFNNPKTYDEWIEMVREQPDDWKSMVDENMNEVIILIKINQQKYINEKFDKLTPVFRDNQGVARCLTRLGNSDLSYDEKYPIALPTCEFTYALMKQAHEDDAHGSVNYSLANFRMRYFTPKARQQFKKIKNHCDKCRQLRTKPLQVFFGNPPSERLNRSHPFEHIGVDIFELKMVPKVSGVIFTCCVTRAVHFEVLDRINAEGVCDAFLVFAALRRTPATVFSDNGTNLKRLGNMFNEAFTVLKEKFHWKFNTPAAPFRGGFYESLIKSMKKGFYSITWRQEIKPQMVRLILYRVQALMNARPLVHDDSTIVTPNHLMYGTNGGGMLTPPSRGVTPSCLLKYWRGTQRLINAAWKTYRDVYLKGLRNYHHNSQEYQRVKVGDEVLIVDNNVPLTSWEIGKIVELIPNSRGIVRTYKVDVRGRILERPAQRLAPLECVSRRGEECNKFHESPQFDTDSSTAGNTAV